MRKALPALAPAVALILAFGSARPAGAAVRVSLNAGFASALQSSDGGGWAAAAAGELDLNPFLALGLRISRAEFAIKGSDSGLGRGRLAVIPVEAFLQFRWPGSGSFKPYLSVGGGYAINSSTLQADVVSSWNAVGFRPVDSIGNAPAFTAAAGFDLAVGSRLFLDVQVRILIATAPGTWSLTDVATGLRAGGSMTGQSLNSVAAGLGLKYGF